MVKCMYPRRSEVPLESRVKRPQGAGQRATWSGCGCRVGSRERVLEELDPGG